MLEKKKSSSGNGIDIIDNNQEISIGQLIDSVTKSTGQRCTSAMIYNYEKHGLIPPPKRTEGGFRLFHIEDIRLVTCIKQWQAQGLSLNEIKERLCDCSDDFLKGFTPELPVSPRMQILKAAKVVFPKKGYAFTTLQDVAKEAGVSSSAIYQHFDNKEDLFLALTESLSFVDALDNINAALGSKDILDFAELRQALIDVAEAFISTHIDNIEIVRLFITESRDYPKVGASYCRFLIFPLEEMLENFFQKNVQLDIFRDVDLKIAVRAFYGMFSNYFILNEILYGKDVIDNPMKQSIEGMVDIFLTGLLNQKS